MEQPRHGIRAAYTESTITVYQAYSPEIGLPAARDGRFPTAWKRDRMTWIIKQRSQTSSMLPSQQRSSGSGPESRGQRRRCGRRRHRAGARPRTLCRRGSATAQCCPSCSPGTTRHTVSGRPAQRCRRGGLPGLSATGRGSHLLVVGGEQTNPAVGEEGCERVHPLESSMAMGLEAQARMENAASATDAQHSRWSRVSQA